MPKKKQRVTFLVDGFNLYNSLVATRRPVKALDLQRLFQSYLHAFPSYAELQDIYFFTAPPTYLQQTEPERLERHHFYTKCLETTGVIIRNGRFKKRPVKCRKCGKYFTKREEKETDVALASKIFELFYSDACDSIALVTGDTDLCPAIRTAKELFPEKQIYSFFPFERYNNELDELADISFSLTVAEYQKFQFPNPFVFPDGTKIAIPDSWNEKG